MHHPTVRIFTYFVRSQPGQTAVVIALLFFMAIMEAIGVATLLPLITLLSEDSGVANQQGAIFDILNFAFGVVQIPLETTYLLLLLVTLMVFKAGFMILATFRIAAISAKIISDLRNQLFVSLLGMRWERYCQLAGGSSVNALGTEPVRAATVYIQSTKFISFILVIIVYGVLALLLNWKLSCLAFAIGFLILLVLKPITAFGRRYGGKETEALTQSSKVFADILANIKPIRAMGKENLYIAALRSWAGKLEVSQRNKVIATDLGFYISEPLIVIFLAGGLIFALEYTEMAFAELLFLAFLFHRFVTRMMNAQKLYQYIVVNESALTSLLNQIESAESSVETHSGKSIVSLTQGIEFSNVSFTYGDKPVLESVTAFFAANKFNAIVGQSGAGKTTLVDLLIGLHHRDSGKIDIDKAPIEDIDIDQWRKVIGYVPQDTILFYATILYNVAMGDPDVTRDDVIDALKQVGAWDFVSQMEQGIDTVVGERGARLSGGQRQRISIARALVHKPKLLILDEATSALDTATQHAILGTIKKLSYGMTIIAISHQESIREYADHVVHLKDGMIVS